MTSPNIISVEQFKSKAHRIIPIPGFGQFAEPIAKMSMPGYWLGEAPVKQAIKK